MKCRMLSFFALAAATIIAGCQQKGEDHISTVARGTRFGSYVVTEVSSAGSLSGRVTVRGNVDSMITSLGLRHVSNGQSECCDGTTEKPQQKFLVRSGGLKNVVVSLVHCDSGKAPHLGNSIIDQHFCDFAPHLTALMAGDSVRLDNSDVIVHAVHGYRGINTVFNIATPRQGGVYHAPCPDTGVIRLLCDAGHVWMEAYIHVEQNPYFAVTDDEGSFTIEGIPPGTYEVRYAHELWRPVERRITIPPSTRASGDAEFDLTNAIP